MKPDAMTNNKDKIEIDLELFRDLINKTNDAIFVHTPQTGHFIFVNDQACSSLGYDRQELLKLSVMDIEATIPDNVSWQTHLNELRRKGSHMLEGIHKRKDGTTFPVEINVSYVVLNTIEYMVAVVRDITERKQAAEALWMHEKQLAESQRIAHIGSWEHNLTTGQVFWSNELFRLLGLDPKTDPADFEMFMEMVHPDDKAVLKKAIDETAGLHAPFNLDYRLILKNGSTRIFHAQAELIHDDTGTQAILSGTCQDITERKLAEEKLRESEQFIRRILDTVDEGFIVIDRDFRILTANAAYFRHYGSACDEIIGRHCYEISHKSLRPCYEAGEDCAVRRVFDEGESCTALHRHTDANGGILYVETKAFPIKDSSGAVISVIETLNDITEKYLLEEERLKTQKLEAIGTLAGGIAHDFNNLLQGIFGYISMAKMAFDQKERCLAMLEQAEQALRMSVNLTTQLLTFSKGGKPVKRRMHLQQVIENSVKFALSGSRAEYRIELAEGLWAVEADEGQIGQVIHNIVLNADQSMPSGGTIVVTAKNVLAPKHSRYHLLGESKYVEVSIEDSGIGIPRQYLEKVFDPYFTTKEKGSGLGLGLAMSYSIIRNHGGVIDAASKVGKGTRFFFYLPAVEAPEETIQKRAALPVPGKGKILVMDDEDLILNIAGEMIHALGHDIDIAKHGESAVEKYRAALESGDPFDIVILDLTIRGGMGGRETVEQLITIDPGIKAVVSSGYSDDAIVSEYAKYGFKARLSKPYKLEDLRDTLHALLSA
jgi:PAS domain S-box-containing protein